MANPSTDGPTSANGTEILRRFHGNVTSAADVKIIDGTAGYIYIVLSVIVCETAGNDETFDLYVNADAATEVFLLDDQVLSARQTFVFSDRIVVAGTDELTIHAGGTANIDVLCSYIEQRWV